jgi:hypothetical protein
MGVSLHSALAGTPAAVLEGALVMLPRSQSFPWLARLRSPIWTLLLPGSIIVGTFGLLLVPSMALAVVFLAAVTSPLLALAGATWVARARLVVIPAAALAAVLAIWASGAGGRLGTAVITALACLTVGTTIQRLVPGRWLVVGVVAMSAVDVALLVAGFGYHQTAVLAAASNSFPGPRFTGARVGAVTIGYPDLFLAALLGAALAGSRDQRRAALLVTGLAIGMDSLLRRGLLLPATVPIALAMIVISLWRWRGVGARRRRLPAPGST